MSGVNPFDDDRVIGASRSRSAKVSSTRISSQPARRRQQRDTEPAIWAARNVEWPIPASLSLSTYQKLVKSSRQAGASMDASIEDGAKDESGDNQNYYGFSGLMSRVLNTSGNSQNVDDLMDDEASVTGARPLRPPRPRCVAASNGWIVAALECGSLLRLVSRWNVRRGSSTSSDPWIALPGAGGDIVHVFVDPTGCHTLLSAINGEAYYLHSSSRVVHKLAGFGPNDTSGLTRGSYVTAVAWDKEKGTEGSTKSILLGTNLGEIFEYTLVSPDATKTESDVTIPLLLHALHGAQSDMDEMAAVTGLHFERIGSGLLVLVATSGRHKRTRLYTFFSLKADTIRSLLTEASSADKSLIELPGSIDFADLRLCNEHFALRTATGVYYGTIDSAAATATPGVGGIIVDAGILPYDNISRSASTIPVSIALTPHHLITLSESNEVRFINRVAQKVIQKERVDWITSSQGQSSSIDESQMSVGELMMDIRRPDQIWLRKARSLVHISSSCEDRDVWKFTLSKCLEMPPSHSPSSPSRGGLPPVTRGALADMSRQMSGAPTIPALTEEENALEAMFEHAKTLCTNTTQKAVVTAVRAECHLSQGRTELAAKYLAQCPPPLAPFADTSVRLALPMLGIDDPQSYGYSQKAKKSLGSSNLALITYLSDKMRVAKMNDDGVVCTMIGAWLAELYLNERERSAASTLGSAGPRKNARATEASHQALLNQFLTNHVNSMDARTIMRILASHDVSAGECSSFAASSGDVGTAVNAALSVGSDEMVRWIFLCWCGLFFLRLLTQCV